MSVQAPQKRLTAPDIRARKGGEPIVMLTSYHAHTARILDQHCDVILVGDSLGMVMHGLETTIPVTLEMMILQGHAVMRGSKQALVVVDLPFGSYEASKEQAFASAEDRGESPAVGSHGVRDGEQHEHQTCDRGGVHAPPTGVKRVLHRRLLRLMQEGQAPAAAVARFADARRWAGRGTPAFRSRQV